jgi:hypothetical protein
VTEPCKDTDEIEERLFANVEINITHDPGCMRTPNGDGWPEHTEVEVLPATVNVPVRSDIVDELDGHRCHQLCRVTRYDGPPRGKHADPDEVMEHEVEARAVHFTLDGGVWTARYELTG